MTKASLTRVVNDKARKILPIKGYKTIVPLKFDRQGKVVTAGTSPRKIILKNLSLNDLYFLKVWRENDWDTAKAIEKSGFGDEEAKRLVRRLSCFHTEDSKIRALADVPTPAWIATKHLENVYEGGRLNDSEHKSLQELAKIQGAYKQQAPTNQVNVFNIALTPEQEAQLKPVFDTLALEAPHDVA